MYIAKIIVKNFKSFIGEHELNLSEGINFLLGIITAGKQRYSRQLNLYKRGKIKRILLQKERRTKILVSK